MSAPHSGIDPTVLSIDVRPQDDFYRHAHAAWLDTHPIPADRAADGSFYQLRDRAEEHVREIIEQSEPGTQIHSLYASFMNEELVNSLGVAPLMEDTALVGSATNHADLARVVGHLQRTGVGGVVGYYVFADQGNPDQVAVYLTQSGISLPDEAYYREDAFAEIRSAFVAHVDRMASLTGQSFTGAGVLALETAIAKHHWDRVKSREADLTYNPTTLADLIADYPGFDWATWADAIHLPEAGRDVLIACEPSFFEHLAALWHDTDLATWQAWLTWRIIAARAPYLDTDVSKANFDFYGTVLSGAEEQRPRWKRAVGLVETVLGEAVGRDYVKEHFPPSHKQHMDDLVDNLIEAYRQSIVQLDWMSDATKTRALEKLAAFTPKIGYPDTWRNYDGLELDSADLMGNVRRASAFEEDWDWSKVGKPVDRSEWLMTPQTVNAYYNPVANEIVFPAAILQPPFFDAEADDAVNYGGIGSVIGHEIGHGFDDQGSKYDGTGMLNDWWTEEDKAAFTERATVLIEQFNGYSPAQLDGSHHVNGALTVGENIGDLAGLEIGLKAYRLACGGSIDDTGDVRGAPELDGFTALQRYFLGYALIEKVKMRDQALITQISTDPHSPSEFRVNGIVRNMGAWYEAFEAGPDDALYLPEGERVSIW